jgi:hypothetical protein
MNDTKPTPLERRRRMDDDPESPFTITRAIPLPWLLSGIIAIIGQAGVVYFAQQRQGELIQAMTIELKAVSQAVNTSTVKDVEHDFRLNDHERRLQAIEKGK